MQLFYTEQTEAHQVILEDEEARHCTQVLRHRIGDAIEVTDGKGFLYHCVIEKIEKSVCYAKILTKDEYGHSLQPRLHLAVAPTKNNERFEWFLEKATEIGIHEITPIICEHSERRVLKTERMKKVLISAIKQSHRTVLPILNEAIDFNSFVQNRTEEQKCIALQQANISFKKWYAPKKNILALIGPEGDFSAKEIQLARDMSFASVTLGAARLRTETAALVTCQAFNFMNEV